MSNPVAPPSPTGADFAAPPAGQGFATAPAEPEQNRAGRITVAVVGLLVILVMVLVAQELFFGDKARNAAVGDCVAASKDPELDEEIKADAEIVDCASADAAFTVVGRVEGERDTTSKSCQKFFQLNEAYFVYASTAGRGYLLCLRPKAA